MPTEDELVASLKTYRRAERQFGSLETHVIEPNDDRVDSVLFVLMHGFGAPREDLVGLAGPLLIECVKVGIRPILAFPGAPIELDFGGAAWWELNMARLMEAAAKNSFDQMRNEVPPGIDAARSALCETIDGIFTEYDFGPEQLVLGGFSQGAMLAVDTAIRGLVSPPAALTLWSGALICEEIWRGSAGDRLRKTAVFQSHGLYDSILPFSTGRALNGFIESICDVVNFVEFAGDHQIPDESIQGAAGLATRMVRPGEFKE